MMLKNPFLSKKRAPRFPLGTIVDELLHAILEHVFENDTQDLLSLCLVSRRFYIPAVEVLYRDLRLNFIQITHKHKLLFPQLSHPKSRIPERIRDLHVIRGATLDEQSCVGLHTLIQGSKHLKNLKWDGPLRTFQDSDGFLELLHLHCPQVKLSIEDGNILKSYESSPQVEYVVHRLLKHAARPQLSSLDLLFASPDELYPDFKGDLISMLKRNEALTHLRLAMPTGSSFPDHYTTLASGGLPRLQYFSLGCLASAFTQRELTAWGDGCGWLDLKELVLSSADCLTSFVGRALNLTCLQLYIQNHEDTDDIYQALESACTASPFPHLEAFGCNTCGPMTQLNLRFMDLKLLKWVSKMTSLQLVRNLNTSDASSLGQGLPTAQNIREIRQYCPDLEDMRIEICLAGRYWKWPFDIIDELARFPKLSTLFLMVSCESNAQGEPRMNRCEHWMLGRRVHQERQRLGLPWQWPFRIEISSFLPTEWLNLSNKTTFTIRNYPRRFGRFKSSTVIYFYREYLFNRPGNLNDSSMEDLESKKYLRVRGVPIWKWRHVTKEIERRKKSDETVKGVDELPTLYDIWTQQHEQAHTARICAA